MLHLIESKYGTIIVSKKELSQRALVHCVTYRAVMCYLTLSLFYYYFSSSLQSLAKSENCRSDKWSCACDFERTPLPWPSVIESTCITWPISVCATKYTRPTIPTVSCACPRRFKTWSWHVLLSLPDTFVSNCTACEKLWYVYV
jgi:hypothetical protein